MRRGVIGESRLVLREQFGERDATLSVHARLGNEPREFCAA